MTNSSPEGRQEAAVLDAKVLHKLQLWFFRDISDDERLSLFSIFGMPVDEIGKVHGHQRRALNHILRALIPAKPAVEVVEAWCQPMNCGKHTPRKFVVMYEDASVGMAVFDNEAEAREHWEKANTNWNCYLLGALPRLQTPATPDALPASKEAEAVAWRTSGREITQLKEVADRWRQQGLHVESLGLIAAEDAARDTADATSALAEFNRKGGISLADMEKELAHPPTDAGVAGSVIAAFYALRDLANRIDADGTASQIGSAEEIREIATALSTEAGRAALSQNEGDRK